MSDVLIPLAIVVLTVIGTEMAAAWIHEHVMHGWGWGWHKSHHVQGEGHFERNDLYTFVFAGISILLFLLGSLYLAPLWWVAVGLCVYGVIYYVLHDGLVHQRWPFRYVPKSGYLRRVYQAHRLHHAVETRDGAVSFGFVFVAPVKKLRAQLRDKRAPLTEETEPAAQAERHIGG